jgi:hypothetical protein
MRGNTHRITATALLYAHGQMGLASGGTWGVSGLRPSGLREAKECHWGWALTAITLLLHRYSPGNRSTKERSARKGAYRQGHNGRVKTVTNLPAAKTCTPHVYWLLQRSVEA